MQKKLKMKIQILNTPNLTLPKQGTHSSSGFDIVATEDPEIVGTTFGNTSGWLSIDYIQYKTGLRIAPKTEVVYKRTNCMGGPQSLYAKQHLKCFKNHHALIYPRSSISKYNLVLANSIGLIDTDYRGEILLRFKYIYQPLDVIFLEPDKYPSFMVQVDKSKIYQKGDKIGQLVFAEANNNVEFERVELLNDTPRGEGGFGHTDE